MGERVTISTSRTAQPTGAEEARVARRAERRQRVRAALGGTLALAATAIPGAGGVGAALAGRALGSSGLGAGGVGAMGQSDPIELLQAQQQIQRESQQFTLQSNIMRARHDMARAAIQNIRS